VSGRQDKQIFLTAAFAAVICSAGLSQFISELIGRQTPQVAELFMQKPTKANFRAFERDLQDNCWLTKRLRPRMQYAQFILFKELGDKAVVGRSGWLFYKPDIQCLIEHMPETDSSQGNIFSAVVSFRDQLAKRGIKLLLVPVPDKASVYPDMLTSRASLIEHPVNSKTLEIITRFQRAGVEVVDLFAVFERARTGLSSADGATYYLLQDSHWSSEGMRLAAKTVGQRILDLGWVQKGQVEYTLKQVTIKRYGDILKMIQVPLIENQFEQEQIDCTQVINPIINRPYQTDPNSKVLVLGDSFLRIYSRDEPGDGGFVEHLAHELGSAISSIVNDGGSSTLVRQQLSRNPGLLTNKKVVVWEFVERDIRFGTEGWQYVPLP
jgi:hypothetical protein